MKQIMKKILSEKEVIPIVKKEFPKMKEIKSIEKLNSSRKNSNNFLINTKYGKYVIRNFLDNIKSNEMEKICKSLEYCKKNKIKVSKPIKTKKGKFIENKNNIYLVKYVSGKEFSGNEKEIIDLAENIAKLHIVLSKIPKSYYFIKNNSKYKLLDKKELKKIKNLIQQKQNKDKYDNLIFDEISFIENCLVKLNVIPNTRNKIKKQFIHSDLNPENVIFNGGKVAAIIDFDSLRMGNVIEDIVQCSFRFAIFKSKSTVIIKRKILIFLEHYNKLNPIELNFDEYVLVMLKITLSKISFLTNQRYIHNSNLWINDLKKFISFAKICQKLIQ